MAVVFFYLYWGNVVLWLKRTSTKKLANRISYQIWHKGCLKGNFGRGVQICEGGSISASGFGPGVQIRCDTVTEVALIMLIYSILFLHGFKVTKDHICSNQPSFDFPWSNNQAVQLRFKSRSESSIQNNKEDSNFLYDLWWSSELRCSLRQRFFFPKGREVIIRNKFRVPG